IISINLPGMAINKNHEFEELDGIKCAIVERNIPQARVNFLQPLLERNGYQVVVTAAAPPKTAPAGDTTPVTEETPALFTLGVTDLMFNPVNAIFGRLLKTAAGQVVTLAYWKQETDRSRDAVPYYEEGRR
ncbi:MAG TPA: hypothetical protein VG842_07805, partial [Sediminibacterium sp.]|nr:hypothetical protein [Sediminibacterium sp.]